MGTPRRTAAAVLLVFLLAGCAGAPGSGPGGDGGATPSTSAPGGSMSPSPLPSQGPSLPGRGLPGQTASGADVTVTGQVEYLDIEGGCYVLRSGGTGYQLMGVPRERLRASETLTVRGRIRTDVLTTCQVGPVLEVAEILPG